jgi:hypothetical protein
MNWDARTLGRSAGTGAFSGASGQPEGRLARQQIRVSRPSAGRTTGQALERRSAGSVSALWCHDA